MSPELLSDRGWTMESELIIDEIGASQGWDDNSKLMLCLQYIENQGGNDAFRDFLLEQAATENASSVFDEKG